MFDVDYAEAHFEADVAKWMQQKFVMKIGSHYCWIGGIKIPQASCRIFRNRAGELEYYFMFGSHDDDGYSTCANTPDEVNHLLKGNIPDFMKSRVVGYPENIKDVLNMLSQAEKVFETHDNYMTDGDAEQFLLRAYSDSDGDIYLVVDSKDFAFFNMVRLTETRDEFADYLKIAHEYAPEERKAIFKEFFKKAMNAQKERGHCPH